MYSTCRVHFACALLQTYNFWIIAYILGYLQIPCAGDLRLHRRTGLAVQAFPGCLPVSMTGSTFCKRLAAPGSFFLIASHETVDDLIL